MKTLLEIFQTEPDDAEISKGLGFATVGYTKLHPFSWSEMNDPIWKVKRKPREWVLSWEHGINNGPTLAVDERVKVVEVIEND